MYNRQLLLYNGNNGKTYSHVHGHLAEAPVCQASERNRSNKVRVWESDHECTQYQNHYSSLHEMCQAKTFEINKLWNRKQ